MSLRELAFWALCATSVCSGAVAAPADWILPGYDSRATFRAPPGVREHLLLTVSPGAEITPQSGFAVCAWGGDWVPFRLLHADAGTLSFLVRTGPFGRAPAYALYYRQAPDPDIRQPPMTDPEPVVGTLHRFVGRSIPNSWGKLLYLFDRARDPVRTFTCDAFGEVELFRGVTNVPPALTGTEPSAPRTRRLGRWPRAERAKGAEGMFIVRLRTVLLCPRDGLYRFGLNYANVAFLLVDGVVQTGGENRYDRDDWSLGPPVRLKAGPHRLEVFACGTRRVSALPGWVTPDASPAAGTAEPAVAPIPPQCLVSAWEATDVVLERRDARLRPNFAFIRQPSYAFRGCPAVFTPVEFRNVTPGLAPDVESRWLFGDGLPPTDLAAFARRAANPVHVFPSEAVHPAALELRGADGYVERAEKSVDCTLVQPREYAADFDLTSVPPVCYGTEAFQPVLHAAGRAGANMAFDVSLAIRSRGGETRETALQIRLPGEPHFVPLARIEPGATDEVRFRVTHAGVPLADRRIRFLEPPFGVLPARAVADRLYAEDGTQLVLVPGRHAGERPAPPLPRETPARVVWLDDMLASTQFPDACGPAELGEMIRQGVGGARHPAVAHVPAPSWDSESDVLGPLLNLVRVPAAASGGAEVVLISVGLQDLVTRRPAAEFERFAAALTDVLATTQRRPVVWVTPPPFPFAPERSRDFAVSVRRICDARGIPVADLYTAFWGMTGNPALMFRGADLGLSRKGQALAGRVIARTLRTEQRP